MMISKRVMIIKYNTKLIHIQTSSVVIISGGWSFRQGWQNAGIYE